MGPKLLSKCIHFGPPLDRLSAAMQPMCYEAAVQSRANARAKHSFACSIALRATYELIRGMLLLQVLKQSSASK
jgi:hypothetical protein